jgi:hypothetical protein
VPTRATAVFSSFRRFAVPSDAAATVAAEGGPASRSGGEGQSQSGLLRNLVAPSEKEVAPAHAAAPSAAASAPAQANSAELMALLQRAGAYVAEYERSFGDLLTEETYTQHLKSAFTGGSAAWRPGRKRTTRADLVFVRLSGEIPWASYRDVFEVDGRKLGDREDRLAKLFMSPRSDAHEQARRLLEASAGYNIGPRRTVNLPTLPLLFLLAHNQARFAFALGPRRNIASTEVVELVFRETARPTFVTGPLQADLPATGRFWVNAGRGTVVRSEVDFDFGPQTDAHVSTDYRPEPTLAMWVPAEMKERFADVWSAKVRTFPHPFEGVARYGKFRRFTVSTEERASGAGQR